MSSPEITNNLNARNKILNIKYCFVMALAVVFPMLKCDAGMQSSCKVS